METFFELKNQYPKEIFQILIDKAAHKFPQILIFKHGLIKELMQYHEHLVKPLEDIIRSNCDINSLVEKLALEGTQFPFDDET